MLFLSRSLALVRSQCLAAFEHSLELAPEGSNKDTELRILKVKVEDANDLRMAEEAVDTAHRFFSTLQTFAAQKGISDYTALKQLRA